MALPRRFLDDGEEVALAVRPHWWCFAPAAAVLLASLSSAVLAASLALPELLQLALLVLTVAALVRFVARYARWATTWLVVTNRRVIHRRGALSRRGTEVPLSRVRAVSCHQSLRERVLRCGEVVIEPVGGLEQRFPRIPRPALVRDEVQAGIEAHRWGWAGGSGGLSKVEQLERLGELCRRGVLTRAEFEIEKGQLLERM